MAKKTRQKKAVTKDNRGRPKGSKNLTLKGLQVITASRFHRKEGEPGLKRITVGTTEEDYSLHLERLAHMLEKKDRRLFKLISPPRAAKKKATTKA
jgi:hypothetical protein